MTMKEFCEIYADDAGCTIPIADGFDEAFVGIAEVDGLPVVCYDSNKCIDILSRDMNRDEAVEYFDFNVRGSYIGKQTPLFLATPH